MITIHADAVYFIVTAATTQTSTVDDTTQTSFVTMSETTPTVKLTSAETLGDTTTLSAAVTSFTTATMSTTTVTSTGITSIQTAGRLGEVVPAGHRPHGIFEYSLPFYSNSI